MYYVKVKSVSPHLVRNHIETALEQRNLSEEDLIRKLGYLHIDQGRRDLAKLYCSGKNFLLLRRISALLQLDHEAVSGERRFENYEDYLRFTFEPTLLRVPAQQRPSSITTVAFVGLSRLLCVGKFAFLRKASEGAQDLFIARQIREDYAKRDNIMSFGKIIGYVFYATFDQARAYAVTGERLTQVEIVPVTVSATAETNRCVLARHSGIIPRLRSLETGEILSDMINAQPPL
ncbi:MAG: hypothetical protein M0O99_01860 [Desulfuromonas thiophila]|jgi:hypothetical protein|nr:hypothetical protein [Desulfuromonas thiophila]